MSKLQKKDQFLDLSDYGRKPATWFASKLKDTRFTAVDVTLLFGVVGLLAVYAIWEGFYVVGGVLIILKSIIDAADGEVARIKNKPSYIGRYLDSLFDFILNILFLGVIAMKTETSFLLVFIAIGCIQLQGTLYHFYYVILRNKAEGADNTSKIFDYKPPKGLHGESQKMVDFLFYAYVAFYGVFDRLIHLFDRPAARVRSFPSWFMTFLSMYGLGFQLLIIAVLLFIDKIEWVIPFFIWYTLFIPVLVLTRKIFITNRDTTK